LLRRRSAEASRPPKPPARWPTAPARRSLAAGAPCIVIPGSVGPGHETALEEGVSAVFPLVGGDVTLCADAARPAA
jgi:glycerate kinase